MINQNTQSLADLARSASNALIMSMIGVSGAELAALSRAASDLRALADCLAEAAVDPSLSDAESQIAQSLSAIRATRLLADADPVLDPMDSASLADLIGTIADGTKAVNNG